MTTLDIENSDLTCGEIWNRKILAYSLWEEVRAPCGLAGIMFIFHETKSKMPIGLGR